MAYSDLKCTREGGRTVSEQATLRQRAERLALEQRWDEEARAVNARLIEIDSRDVPAHTRLALYYRRRGDLQTARALYRRVLSLEHSNSIAINALVKMERERVLADVAQSASTYHDAFTRGVAARNRHAPDLAVA